MNNSPLNSYKRKIAIFQLTRFFFLYAAAALVVIGIGSLARVVVNLDHSHLYLFYVLLVFVDAVIMVFCAFQLNKKNKPIFFFSAFVLFLNIFPTIFDQLDIVSVQFRLLILATLVFLILSRKEFFPA